MNQKLDVYQQHMNLTGGVHPEIPLSHSGHKWMTREQAAEAAIWDHSHAPGPLEQGRFTHKVGDHMQTTKPFQDVGNTMGVTPELPAPGLTGLHNTHSHTVAGGGPPPSIADYRFTAILAEHQDYNLKSSVIHYDVTGKKYEISPRLDADGKPEFKRLHNQYEEKMEQPTRMPDGNLKVKIPSPMPTPEHSPGSTPNISPTGSNGSFGSFESFRSD